MNFRFFLGRPNLAMLIAGNAGGAVTATRQYFAVYLFIARLADAISQRCAKSAPGLLARLVVGIRLFHFWLVLDFIRTAVWTGRALPGLLPLSALALPCAMAIYIGLMGSIIYYIARRTQNKKFTVIFLFPIFFTIFELLRGHLFSGFPWNIIGITLTEYSPLFQTASIIGENMGLDLSSLHPSRHG